MVDAPLQVIRPELLTAGFKLVQEQSLEVTDDVSIIEALGKPVKITYGSYSNIKVEYGDSIGASMRCRSPMHVALDQRF